MPCPRDAIPGLRAIDRCELEPAQEQRALQVLSLSWGSGSHINRKSLALSCSLPRLCLPPLLAAVMQAPALGCLAPTGGAAAWPLTSRLRISCGSRGGRRGPFFQTLGLGVKGPLRDSPARGGEAAVVLCQQHEVGGGEDAMGASLG